MKKQESDILNTLLLEPFVNQRILSEVSGHSLGVVNRSLKNLISSGYLDENIRPTNKAKKELEQKSPKNAIILAAGFGMRMVPINTQGSKALMEVNGEPLIERTIRQLHQVGIREIHIVVGFMKEQFEYLIDEYGVDLIVNEQYATKNNLHSLALASSYLSNSYIIPCDIWCDRNPFHRHELYSWYMVSDLMDDDSTVRVNRKMELVTSNQGGNAMVGISYLVEDQCNIVRERLQKFDNDMNYNESFWEETLYEKDRMFVQARVVHANDVVEINTYEQLRELDEDSNHLKSDAIQVICTELECRREDIIDIEVLKKGMTNRSFLFRVDRGENKGRYIMRIPGEGTDQLIDRTAEALVYQTISGLHFCDDPVYINPDNGYKITRYIEGVRCCDPENEDDLRLCMKKLRRFHATPLTVPHTFDLFERIDFYESLWDGQPSIYKDYRKTKENCKRLANFIDKHRGQMQLTHIDAVPDNFLFDPNTEGELSIQLTDWEYAGMQDKHVDIAMFCIYSMYEKEQIDKLIDIYFEDDGGCDKATRAKIYCYVSVCGLIWSNWCEYKRNLGVEFGEYSLCQYRYAKEYYKLSVELMTEIGEPLEGEQGT